MLKTSKKREKQIEFLISETQLLNAYYLIQISGFQLEKLSGNCHKGNICRSVSSITFFPCILAC